MDATRLGEELAARFGEVADQAERSAGRAVQVELEKILLPQVQEWEALTQMRRSLAIDLHAGQVNVIPEQQVPGQCTRSGADLDHLAIASVEGEAVRDPPRDGVLLEEMLPIPFLGSDHGQAVWTTSNSVRKAAKRPA